jgi:hypothetical protein
LAPATDEIAKGGNKMKKRKKINFTKSNKANSLDLIKFGWEDRSHQDYQFYNHRGELVQGFLTIDKERFVALAMCFQYENWRHITKILAVKESDFFRSIVPLELSFDSGLDRAWANSVPLGEVDITINF